MKKIIISLSLVAMTVITVEAQQPHDSVPARHHSARHRGDSRIAQRLNFSEQQQQQIKSIRSDYRNKLMSLKKNEDITVREAKTQKTALRMEYRKQWQALLTPAQKDQLAKMKQQRRELAKVNTQARAEKMKIKLGLSDAQASQFKDARAGMVAKLQSIRADQSLSQEQKREQIKNVVLQQKDQLKSILTHEQLQTLQQMRAQHHRAEFSR